MSKKRPGHKYKPGSLGNDYDAIVVGSGMGGLSTAAILAKAGKKVLVLERHYTPGGFTQSYTRKGYEWDVGVHYLGKVHDRGAVLRRVFDYITESSLEWAKLADVYDRLVFDDATHDCVSGRERFEVALIEAFPGEADAIRQYMRLIVDVEQSSQNFFLERALPPWLGTCVYPFLARKFRRYSDRSTLDVLRGLTGHNKLIGVLTGQYGDYGLPPGQSSFAMHGLLAEYYLEGANYPIGGGSRIARGVEAVIERAGGRIVVNAEVAEVLIRRERAIGVRLANNDEITAPVVVSDIGLRNTLTKLVPGSKCADKLRRRMRQVGASTSHICLYVGFKESNQAMHFNSTQYWVLPGYDHDSNVARYLADPQARMPLVWITFPSAKDPEWDRRYPGRATLTAVTLASYDWFSRWRGTEWHKRGTEYDDFKEQFAQRLLAEVYRQVPQAKGKVDYYELSTPLSTQHFCNHSRGEIFGLELSPTRFQQRWLRPHLPIKNLYLCGQDIVTNGVGASAISGVLTASAILQRNVLKDIL